MVAMDAKLDYETPRKTPRSKVIPAIKLAIATVLLSVVLGLAYLVLTHSGSKPTLLMTGIGIVAGLFACGVAARQLFGSGAK